MSTILTFFSRTSTSKVRVEYSFTIKTLFTDKSNSDNIEIGDQLSISIERGKKHLDSTDGAVKRLDNSRIGVDFNNELLLLPATLYKKKKTGVYNEKAALIRVRQRRKGTVGLKNTPDAFKTIGVIPIQLQSILHCDNMKIAFPLKFCMIEGMKLEILINIKMDKSSESVVSINEISTNDDNKSDDNNNNHNNTTDDDNNNENKSKVTNLKINLSEPDKNNTPIKEMANSRNPSPEVTKWKDIDAQYNNDNTKSSPNSNTNDSTKNDGFNWDDAFNKDTTATMNDTNAFKNFDNSINNNYSNNNNKNNNNNNNDDDDDIFDSNQKLRNSLKNIEKSVLSIDNALGSTDSFAPSTTMSPSSPSSSSSSSDKIKQLELLLKITIDERDSAIRTRAHLEGLLKEKEKENQGLLQKLIETKVELVSTATKLETSKSEQAKYKSRCSMYASRICKLEVSLVESKINENKIPNNKESPRSRSSSIRSSTPTFSTPSSKIRSSVTSPTNPTNPFE